MLSDDYLRGFRSGLGRSGMPTFRRYRNPEGAFDSQIERSSGSDTETARELVTFLKDKLTDDDLNHVLNLLSEVASGVEEYMKEDADDETGSGYPPANFPLGHRRTSDEPASFRGMPRPGGSMVHEKQLRAMDRALSRQSRNRESFLELFPDAARIKIL
jgi:hypothetical protein